jgi:hypothetical protein
MVAVTGAVPAFTPLKAAMSPLPEAARPMDELLFVQAYVVPDTGLLNVIAVVGEPLHTVWFTILFTPGVGFTVMVNVSGVPGQPLAVGVAVMVAVTGAAPVFTALKDAMLPLPEAPNPMDGSLLVHA